ncbi:sensor histidine kinase [Pseudomonas fulva]|uniref:PAS domain-containing sensor histidine kinase n=1 Tax=Pseudomonas fulva TaxID=47880 RepID=UPI0015F41375|nr:HAMP domain-containing sensor histidine kinase [Pseudomonas fulva]MBA5707388.1 sensor histidine kinase [Pseudomonas fulva]
MDNTPLLSTQLFFEHAPCALVVMAPDGTLVRCNQTLADWLGYDSATLHAMSFDQLLPADGRVFLLTHWGPLLNMQGSISEVKIALRHRDGRKLPMLLSGVRRESDDGIRYHLALFSALESTSSGKAALEAMQRAEEMLAQKIEAESALQRAQAELAAAYQEVQRRAVFSEQMVAIASHDLKNPLTAIQMAASMLKHDLPSDRARRLLTGIDNSTERALRMIVDLLDFASVRLGPGMTIRRERVDLVRAVDYSVSELKVAFPDAQIRHYARGRRVVQVDPDRLQQVIGNLVANGVAYGDLRYPITLTTDFSDDGAVVSVHNHGAAIDDALLPTLFEPMTRGSDCQDTVRSVGLGLFIVKKIAEAHGGSVSMCSDGVLGTRFEVWLG